MESFIESNDILCKKIKILPSVIYRNIGIANFDHAHSHFGRYPD
jgi:hypothetical protein